MRSFVLILIALLAAPAAAGPMFRGFSADETTYRTNYNDQVCTTGSVSADGKVTAAPACRAPSTTEATYVSPRYGAKEYTHAIANGRLRLEARASGSTIELVALDAAGTSIPVMSWDTGEPVKLASPTLWRSRAGTRVAIEYRNRRAVAAFDISARLARIAKQLRPISAPERMLLWDATWKQARKGCTAGIEIKFAPKGKAAVTTDVKCLKVRAKETAEATWHGGPRSISVRFPGVGINCTLETIPETCAPADDCLVCEDFVLRPY